ncbi:MAG: DUF4116 domain-containing protein [Deltaproteobacteria bacterium]|nr:DUF4116 domain-containing protein [Deltaproteobacteria bacterium]
MQTPTRLEPALEAEPGSVPAADPLSEAPTARVEPQTTQAERSALEKQLTTGDPPYYALLEPLFGSDEKRWRGWIEAARQGRKPSRDPEAVARELRYLEHHPQRVQILQALRAALDGRPRLTGKAPSVDELVHRLAEYDPEALFERLTGSGSYADSGRPHIPAPFDDSIDFVSRLMRKDNRFFERASLSLRGDRELALEYLTRSRAMSRFDALAPALQTDPAFLLEAITLSPEILEILPRDLRHRRDLGERAVEGLPHLLQHASDEVRGDRAIARRALAKNPNVLEYLTPELQRDPELLELAVRSGLSLRKLPEGVDQEPLIRAAIESERFNYWEAPASVHEDPVLLRRLALLAGQVPSKLEMDPEVVLNAIRRGRTELILSSALFGDPAFLAEAAKASFAVAVHYAHPPPDSAIFAQLKPLVIQGLREHRLDPRRVSPELAQDPDIAAELLRRDPVCIRVMRSPSPEILALFRALVLSGTPMSDRLDWIPEPFQRDFELLGALLVANPGNRTTVHRHLEHEELGHPGIVAGIVRLHPESYASLAETARDHPLVVQALLEKDPLRLGEVPERYRDDPERVFECVRRAPAAYRFASPRLRGFQLSAETPEDERRAIHALADLACSHHGANLAQLAPELVTLSRALAAVSDDGLALAHAGPHARDPKVLALAIVENPDAMRSVPKDLPGYADLSIEATKRSLLLLAETGEVHRGLFFKGLGTDPKNAVAIERFRALSGAEPLQRALEDAAFVERLLRLEGRLYRELPRELQRSERLLAAALTNAPEVLDVAPEELKTLERARAWVAENPRVFRHLDLAFRRDRSLALAAVAANHTQIHAVDPSLFDDTKFLAACVELNPFVWNELASRRRREITEAFPALAHRYDDVRRDLDRLGISKLERFHDDWPLLKTIIENRAGGRTDDPRPVAVMIYAKEDYNDALTVNSAKDLSRHYRVMYYEASSLGGLTDALHDATLHRRASILEIAGHGSPSLLALGAPDPANKGPRGPGSAYLKQEDGRLLANARAGSRVLPGGHVVLKSCLNAEGTDLLENVANTVGQIFRHAHVEAARDTMMSRIRLHDDGRFRSGGIEGSRARTYRIPARTRL